MTHEFSLLHLQDGFFPPKYPTSNKLLQKKGIENYMGVYLYKQNDFGQLELAIFKAQLRAIHTLTLVVGLFLHSFAYQEEKDQSSDHSLG